ncbi:hypothetical protein SPRG_06179 [Saprolegnia parasitica CBS 223.65]|uniref:Cell morphogenesis protein N-terminal domain-containing protein n=1 Tax=Saprolegnia parasitica (strain CBS 223.65) TaxID=695850 RepID=A0A067CF57_SAPPC|nr:hypothetical protein SPRG_06179 [Saprolegnia parasitica CBS 223.65]KDO29123.1 hypothetical protein SPRG_06179 [Saprolegnia parasitica CBS 223.65]|eukprot:XP_012200289.1 hypothetical protein SPRG_06179 [Saprolegnia parasitica CBS 223.65]
MDDAVVILRRELDAFMATHGSTVLARGSDVDPAAVAEMTRLSSLWTCMATRNFMATVDTLLKWQVAKVEGSVFVRAGHYLVGHLLYDMLQALSSPCDERLEATLTRLVRLTLKLLSERKDLEAPTAKQATDFFSFKLSTPALLVDDVVQAQWQKILGLLGQHAIGSIHAAMDETLSRLDKTPSMPKDVYLATFSSMQLQLLQPRYDEATAPAKLAFLRALLSLASKPQRLPTRLAALRVLAAILHRELAHGLPPPTRHVEWNSFLSDLHAVAYKLCLKKQRQFKTIAIAWDVRLVALMLSNAEIFARYWRDDAMALLRVHSQLKDATSLGLLSTFLKHLLRRHSASRKTLPLEKDVMDIINLIQAWCFCISKHKPTKLLLLLGHLVEMSVLLASYNLAYCLQSHVRQLILEADSIFDERRLVGLAALRAILLAPPTDDGSSWDRALLAASHTSVADVVGSVLIESNTVFGSGIVGATSKASAYKTWVGLRVFEAAIACTQVLFSDMQLSDEHKTMILTRVAVHSELSLRQVASDALLYIASTCLGAVVDGIYQHVVRLPLSDKAFQSALPTLLHLVQRICETTNGPLPVSHGQAIEAMCLYVLCSDNIESRLGALDVLAAVAALRQRSSTHATSTINVLDILRSIDDDLALQLGLSTEDMKSASRAGSVLKWLAQRHAALHTQRLFAHVRPEMDDDDDASTDRDAQVAGVDWLWSLGLATLWTRVCEACPELLARIWSDVNDAAHRLEPPIPVLASGDDATSAQWRHCSIMACASAHIGHDNVTRASVAQLLERQRRYLKSPSPHQRQAAVLALGATHSSAHALLFEHLASLELDAFCGADLWLATTLSPPTSPPSLLSNGGPKMTKRGSKHQLLATKSLGIQSGLQWALARIYRSLLSQPHSMFMWSKRTFRRQLLGFLEKVHAHVSSPTLLLRSDVCAILEAIVHHSNLAFGLVTDEPNQEPSLEDAAALTTAQRYRWFETLAAWSRDVAPSDALAWTPHVWTLRLPTTVDEALARCSHPLRPTCDEWIEMCYGVLHAACAAIAGLLLGPAFDVPAVFAWLDELLTATTLPPTRARIFSRIRRLLGNGVRLFLSSGNDEALCVCIERCLGAGACTKEYVMLLADVLLDLRAECRASRSFPKLLFVGLLHMESNSGMQILLTLLEAPETTRMESLERTLSVPFATTAASLWVNQRVAISYKSVSPDVVAALLTFVHKCPSILVQSRLLEMAVPWVQNLASTAHVTALLFRVTTDLQVPSVARLWIELVASDENLRVLLELVYAIEANEKLTTAQWILSCIEVERLTVAVLAYDTDERRRHDRVLDTAARTIAFLAPHVHAYGASHMRVLRHLAVSVLYGYASVQPLWRVQDEALRATVVADCARLLEATTASVGLRALVERPSLPSLDELRELLTPLGSALSECETAAWADACQAAFGGAMGSAQEQLYAQCSLYVYRLLQPRFNGAACVHLLNLLRSALDDVDAIAFVHEYLLTLTHLAQVMPPSKLVLFPQLLWVAIALLKHSQSQLLSAPMLEPLSLQGPSLSLLHAVVSKPSFFEPIVHDMLLARRPPQWKPHAIDCTFDVLAALSQQLTSPETEAIVLRTAKALLFQASSVPHGVVLTALLLPSHLATPCRETAHDLGYLWRLLGELELAEALTASAPIAVDELAPHLVRCCLRSPSDEKLFLDVLLAIVVGHCRRLHAPTLQLVLHLVLAAPPTFWKRNGTLLAVVTRLLHCTPSSDSTWPTLLSLLSTLLPPL